MTENIDAALAEYEEWQGSDDAMRWAPDLDEEPLAGDSYYSQGAPYEYGRAYDIREVAGASWFERAMEMSFADVMANASRLDPGLARAVTSGEALGRMLGGREYEVRYTVPVVMTLDPMWAEIEARLVAMLSDNLLAATRLPPTLWQESADIRADILEAQRRVNDSYGQRAADAFTAVGDAYGWRGAEPRGGWYDEAGNFWEPIPDLVEYVAARAHGRIHPPVGLVEDGRGNVRFAEGTRVRGRRRVAPLNPVGDVSPSRPWLTTRAARTP